MGKRGKVEKSVLASEALALHRTLVPQKPPLLSVYRMLIQAQQRLNEIAKGRVSNADQAGVNDLAAAVMECALRLSGEPGPIRRSTLTLLRQLSKIITSDSLLNMMDVVQGLLTQKHDEDKERVSPAAAAVVTSLLASTGLLDPQIVSKALSNVLQRMKKASLNEFSVTAAETLAAMDSTRSKTLDKIYELVCANKDVPGEGGAFLALLFATANSTKSAMLSLSKIACKGTFSTRSNDKKLWAVTAAVCFCNIAARKVVAEASASAAKKGEDGDFYEDKTTVDESEEDALRLALQLAWKADVGDEITLLSAVLQNAVAESRQLNVQNAILVALEEHDSSKCHPYDFTRSIIQAFLENQAVLQLVDVPAFLLGILADEASSHIGEQGRGIAARLITFVADRVDVGICLGGSRLRGVLELIDSIRYSEDDFARDSCATLCAAIANHAPHLRETLFAQSLEGLRVADLSLSTAPPPTSMDELPLEFVHVLGNAAILAGLVEKESVRNGVPSALLQRCCEDALAFLKVHSAALKGNASRLVALARRRVGWGLLAAFAKAKLLRSNHLKSLPTLLKHELAIEMPSPKDSKNYYQLVLHASSRAAALAAIAECLEAGFLILGVDTILGAAARRLAFHADARRSASSDSQCSLSDKVYRTEAPRLFHCVRLAPPSGSFGDILYYLALVQLSLSNRHSAADVTPECPISSLFSLEGTYHCSDASLFGFVTNALPALLSVKTSREILLVAITELSDISPSICTSLALHTARRKDVNSGNVLSRVQAVLRRVVHQNPAVEIINAFELPQEVQVAASAYLELSKTGGPSLWRGFLSLMAGLVHTSLESNVNIAIVAIVILTSLEKLCGTPGYAGESATIEATLRALESSNPALRYLAAGMICAKNPHVNRNSEKLLSELLNALIRCQTSNSVVYTPPGNLVAAEALLEQSGEVDAYGFAAAAVLESSRAEKSFVLTRAAVGSAQELICELISWALPQKASARAAALEAMDNLWGVLLDQKSSRAPLTVDFFCFGGLTVDRLRVVLLESLSFNTGVSSLKVRRNALRCLAQLRRGLPVSRLLVAIPELPEALFLCMNAPVLEEEKDIQNEALVALLSLSQLDSHRRCSYWLQLCKEISMGELRAIKDFASPGYADDQRIVGNEFPRAAAAAVTRCCLESIIQLRKKAGKVPDNRWIDPCVLILQRMSTAVDSTAFGTVQGLYVGLRLVELFPAKDLWLYSAQIQSSLNALFSPSQHPTIVSAAAQATSSMVVLTSGSVLFSGRMVARFHDIDRFPSIYQYDRFSDMDGVRTVLALITASARLVCDAVEKELGDVLVELKPALPKMSTVFAAVSGDIGAGVSFSLKKASKRPLRSPFQDGSAVTVADKGVLDAIRSLPPDVVVAAVYLLPLPEQDFDIRWCNDQSPGAKFVTSTPMEKAKILLSLLIYFQLDRRWRRQLSNTQRRRCNLGLTFMLKRLRSHLSEEELKATLNLALNNRTEMDLAELLECLVIEGKNSSMITPLQTYQSLMDENGHPNGPDVLALAKAVALFDDGETQKRALWATVHVLTENPNRYSSMVITEVIQELCTCAGEAHVQTLVDWGLASKKSIGMLVAAVAISATDTYGTDASFIRHVLELVEDIDEDADLTAFHDPAMETALLKMFKSSATGELKSELVSRMCVMACSSTPLGKVFLKLIIMAQNSAASERDREAIGSILWIALAYHACSIESEIAPWAAEVAIRLISTDVAISKDIMSDMETTRKATFEASLRSAVQGRSQSAKPV
eukprot:CAMPEP_0184752800 /NCGR_PEP_ID=MMETSP0315-20130426/43771_1 /TAXON_ID=101924 /ORGANISM="Rhodosorus marinus, Strain UTEX LB 2760" /LENGTH=1771 /DNA_ID=CAMNT_0027232153 /DNA_START=54 /DNA_END=5369 /DNA_ORIENTATION=-